MTTFLRTDARKGPGRVDQANDRQSELRGQFHAIERLAIAFGMGTAVLALVAFFEGVPFLMADQHDAMIAEPGEAGP